MQRCALNSNAWLPILFLSANALYNDARVGGMRRLAAPAVTLCLAPLLACAPLRAALRYAPCACSCLRLPLRHRAAACLFTFCRACSAQRCRAQPGLTGTAHLAGRAHLPSHRAHCACLHPNTPRTALRGVVRNDTFRSLLPCCTYCHVPACTTPGPAAATIVVYDHADTGLLPPPAT